jgi:hypothetical protein
VEQVQRPAGQQANAASRWIKSSMWRAASLGRTLKRTLWSMLSTRLKAILREKLLNIRTSDTANSTDTIARNLAGLQKFLGLRFAQAQPPTEFLSRESFSLVVHIVLLPVGQRPVWNEYDDG